MTITNDIKYVGVNDHDVDLFEGQYDVPNGMAYNSYVILDDKIAVMDTVEEEITSSVFKYKKQDLEQLIKKFNFEHLLKRNPKTLSGGEQQLMYVISSLLKHPKILIFDKAFSMLDNLMKDKILKMLKKLSKEENITIINITNETEDVIYGDNIAIITDKKIIINDFSADVKEGQKIFIFRERK